MANSADPDQLASSDLDLHRLQRQDISGFSRTRVKVFLYLRKLDKVISGSCILLAGTNLSTCFGDITSLEL